MTAEEYISTLKSGSKGQRMKSFIRWWIDSVGGRALNPEEYNRIKRKI